MCLVSVACVALPGAHSQDDAVRFCQLRKMRSWGGGDVRIREKRQSLAEERQFVSLVDCQLV